MIFVIRHDEMSEEMTANRGRLAFRAETKEMTQAAISDRIFERTGKRYSQSAISRWLTDGEGARVPDGDARAHIEVAFPAVWSRLWSLSSAMPGDSAA